MEEQDRLTVVAHVREISHVWGEKMDVYLNVILIHVGLAQMSHLTLIFYTLHKQINIWRLRLIKPVSFWYIYTIQLEGFCINTSAQFFFLTQIILRAGMKANNRKSLLKTTGVK